MDEPIRHREIDGFVVRSARRMTPTERLVLAAGLTDAVMALSRAGQEQRERTWREKPSKSS